MPAYKDGNTGNWYVSFYYTDWTGKKKRKLTRGFRTKKEAIKFETEFKRTASADMDMQLESFVDVYFNDKKNELKSTSVKNKRDMINSKILPYFGSKKMNEVTPADVIQWQNTIKDMGYKETYNRMIQNQLCALFNHAEKIYGITKNPCKKVKKIGKSDADKLDFWIKNEYDEFISQVPEDSMYHLIFEILFWTGMREGELLALTKSDIDFNKNQIHITKTYTRINKEDVISTPKTENSVRTIDIPASLAKDIKAYIDALYEYPEDERLFPIVARTLQKMMQKYTEMAGVKKIRVHDLRHSHVAYLIHMGVQPLIIKERLGHKDIQITLNTYGHLYPSEQKQVADLLDSKR